MERKLNVLVTGGTRGIGAAIAARFMEQGYDVVVTGTKPDGQGPEGCAYLAADFSSETQREDVAGRIAEMNFDVLVNNAGINKIGPLDEYDSEDFARILDVNLKAPFALCKAVVPGMKERGFGRIVNITSVFGVVSKAMRSAYSSSKFGLLGMTRALALEVASKNILVNCVAPGFVDTELTRRVLGDDGIREMAERIPAGRLAVPGDIAPMVAFLGGPDNTYITGQNIVIDGGFVCA